MNITHKIKLDMQENSKRQTIFVKQGDSMSRCVEITLYNSGTAWTIPSGDTILQIAYYKSDRTGGVYDTMPDNTVACTYSGNVVTAHLHPQMFTVSGIVVCELRLLDNNGTQLSTFSWFMSVAEAATNKIGSEDYFNFVSLKELRKDIGEMSDLETNAKESLVVAINECYSKRIVPVAAHSGNGFSYAASGEQLPTVVPGKAGAHVGKGTQIVFIPGDTNTDPECTLQINSGAIVPIRRRAKTAIGANVTLPVAAGSLIRGVPYTMTFCGLYWLLDSYVPFDSGSGGGVDAEQLTQAVEAALEQAKASGEFDGPKGDTGEQGPKGDKGDTGATGAAGKDGADGKDGKTPENGVDYFTEADKAEMVQAVTEAVGEVSGVPAYVVTAADAVIDKVAAAQGGRTLTIGAITDLHYGSWGYYEGITDYRKGVDHACQALKYIDERIKLDAVAVLGDYTDGMASTQQGTAIADFKGVNAVLDALRFAPNLRLQGNHDFVAEKSPLAYRYIGAYNDGSVEWGNALGGYFYKDFGAQKLRVIGLNTSETGNGGVYCSVAQYEWFIRALDLSDKADASEWGILILSHVPLDMWAEGGRYRFSYILDAYKKGEGWSDDAVACDFAGKNAAVLVGCIHGHVHNFKVDKLYLGNIEDSSTQIDVWRMATPNACFGLENKDYTGYQEAISYTKTADSASDTAFCVYCIDLDSKTIKAICYGAGFDRTLNYADGTVIAGTTYSVTNRLDKVTNSNKAGIVAEGSAYTATLSTEGEMTSVTVTMGGVDITDTVYTNGTITIPRVTGDVVITATAVVVELVNVLAAATDANGNVYNGVGWKNDTRYSGSSNAEQAYENVDLSGYISYDGKESTVYLKNVSTTSRLLVWYFATKGSYRIKRELSQGTIPDVVYGADGNVARFTLEGGGGDKFIRIECSGFSADSIVTINQPIE